VKQKSVLEIEGERALRGISPDRGYKHFVVVCGYGCHIEGTPLPTAYFPKVIRFIREENPHAVVFCGGETQKKSAPGVSEARMMAGYIAAELPDAEDTQIGFLLEEESYTTYENIERAAHRIRFFQERCRLTIFCEATRSANVMMLARHFMIDLVTSIDDITLETGSWERADPFKQAGNLIYNWWAIRFPYLARREHDRRVARSFHI
jgi:hypothetical protein